MIQDHDIVKPEFLFVISLYLVYESWAEMGSAIKSGGTSSLQ
jgi:hypothetical protein